MGLYANRLFAGFVDRIAKKIKEKQEVKRAVSSDTSCKRGKEKSGDLKVKK